MLEVLHYQTCHHPWLIKQFETFRFDIDGSIYDKFIPRPEISLIFHFKDIPLIIGEKTESLPSYFAVPIIEKAVDLEIHGYMDSFVVICRPTSLSRFFHLEMTPAIFGGITLPEEIFHPLWQLLSLCRSTEERIACFNSYIYNIQKEPYKTDTIDSLYDLIIEKSIAFSMEEIMQCCNSCSRTLQRNFVKRTGVTPKFLMRVVRLHNLWTRVGNLDAVDYLDMVFDGNYFDQAHFIKDFKAITGETPGSFFKRNLEIIRKFSGKTYNL